MIKRGWKKEQNEQTRPPIGISCCSPTAAEGAAPVQCIRWSQSRLSWATSWHYPRSHVSASKHTLHSGEPSFSRFKQRKTSPSKEAFCHLDHQATAQGVFKSIVLNGLAKRTIQGLEGLIQGHNSWNSSRQQGLVNQAGGWLCFWASELFRSMRYSNISKSLPHFEFCAVSAINFIYL